MAFCFDGRETKAMSRDAHIREWEWGWDTRRDGENGFPFLSPRHKFKQDTTAQQEKKEGTREWSCAVVKRRKTRGRPAAGGNGGFMDWR